MEEGPASRRNRYNKIASVHLRSGLVFGTLLIESSGGSDPMLMTGLSRRDAAEAHRLIKHAQAHFMGSR